MFVAARVICDSSELCPRRLIKASKGMSMENMLWDGRLWDGVIGDRSALKSVGIDGFNSPMETPESVLKLNWTDTVESSVALGFNFFVFRLTNTNASMVRNTITDSAVSKKDGQRGSGVDSSIAIYDKFELIKMRHSIKATDKNEESKRGIMCPCGKELVNMVGFKNHQMWCKLKSGNNSNNSAAAKSQLRCSCGSQFDDQAKYKSHVASCAETKGQMAAVSGKRRRSLSPAQSSDDESVSESESRSELTCPGCGRTFSRKYNCGVHVKYCRSMVKEEEKPRSRPAEWACECGKIYFRRDRYLRHQESCAIHVEKTDGSVKAGAEAASRSAFNCECGRRFFRHNTYIAHSNSCADHLKHSPSASQEPGVSAATAVVKSEKLLEGQIRCVCSSVFYSHSGLQRHHKTCSVFKSQSAATGGGEASPGFQDGSPSRQISRKSMLSESNQMINKYDIVKTRVRRSEDSSPARMQERAVKESPSGGKEGASKRTRDDSEEECDEFEVEMILLHVGSQANKKNLKFLIRWKGYDAAHDSWLSYAECKELKALDEYCKLHTDLQL